MVGWIIVTTGIILIGLVVVFKWKQRKAGHIAYWQQQRAVERHKGEAASRQPDSPERRQKMDHAKASTESLSPHGRGVASQGWVSSRQSTPKDGREPAPKSLPGEVGTEVKAREALVAVSS
jgi:hypothetical protein